MYLGLFLRCKFVLFVNEVESRVFTCSREWAFDNQHCCFHSRQARSLLAGFIHRGIDLKNTEWNRSGVITERVEAKGEISVPAPVKWIPDRTLICLANKQCLMLWLFLNYSLAEKENN